MKTKNIKTFSVDPIVIRFTEKEKGIHYKNDCVFVSVEYKPKGVPKTYHFSKNTFLEGFPLRTEKVANHYARMVLEGRINFVLDIDKPKIHEMIKTLKQESLTL